MIGASAGAVEALSVLLPALGRDLRVPVVVVVHLPPRRPSLLAELFRARCNAPVLEPVDKQPVGAGTVWFAPADYHLAIEVNHSGGRESRSEDSAAPGLRIRRNFAFSTEPPVHFSRPAVDVLFESAAHAYGDALAAVVLSGASEDGARGARMVRQRGGRVYVQAPNSAVARVMPEAAIRETTPEFVGPLEEIAALLCEATGQST